MFRLFSFEYGGSTFEIFGSSWSGLECLVVDGQEVARKRNFRHSSTYEFTSQDLGALALSFRVQMAEGKVAYELRRNGVGVLASSVPIGMPGWVPAPAQQQAAESPSSTTPRPARGGHTVV